jgi:hypothetical protein
MPNRTEIPDIFDEYRSAKLGDPRRVKRACRIAGSAARAPEKSLPRQAGCDSELEATYRFLNNEAVGAEELFAAHARCTVERAAQAGEVLVIHDTTGFKFGGELLREGLGPVTGPNSQGFFTHASLCVGRDGHPFGLLGLYSWVRTGEKKGKRAQQVSQYDPDRESLRWFDGVESTAELLHGEADAIQVMDREGDCMELFASLVNEGHRFVIRLSHDRKLRGGRKASGSSEKLFEALSGSPMMLTREVPLSARGGKGKRRMPRQNARFPARKTRMANLEVRARTLVIHPGNGSVAHIPKQLELNFVEVREVEPPEGEPPVIWRLATTEPIETAEQIAAVIDIYRLRWLIEEYFKALKTGCNFEKLQLESGRALIRALAIFVSVAWRLLLIRWMDRNRPNAPASTVLSPTQLAALCAVRARAGKPLPENPTAHDVLMAIAALGAHLKRNGPPGWRVLGRGFEELLMIELGWLAAMGQIDVQENL